ncbi:MAG TPA: hypothetical protein VLC46_01160 [Thermoanaerobaculia bacterium]|jgi:hypothetical protein|nr:hypothetical protein [Thermoanaerobaculia bacterium]
MSWQAVWAPRALKELARLDRAEQHRVRQAVEVFAGESKATYCGFRTSLRPNTDSASGSGACGSVSITIAAS